MRLIVFFLLGWTLTQPYAAESPSSLTPLETLYDYRLVDTQSQKAIPLTDLVKKLADQDIIFLGEFHGNHAVHLFQAQLQAALYKQNPNQILSMEQFNRDQQTILNRYLDNEIGEKTLIQEAPTWPNYAASYRPLVEFAKQQFIPVVAANAPADIVRCVGRKGQSYLKKLPSKTRNQLPKSPFYSDPAYQAKFAQLNEHRPQKSSSAKGGSNTYFAQLLRDNSMAESILTAHSLHPGSQVIHVNGAFHSNEYLGTVSALRHRNARLKTTVISPISLTDPSQPTLQPSDLALGDYLLLVSPQPIDYVQAAKRRAAMQSMFEKSNTKPCL